MCACAYAVDRIQGLAHRRQVILFLSYALQARTLRMSMDRTENWFPIVFAFKLWYSHIDFLHIEIRSQILRRMPLIPASMRQRQRQVNLCEFKGCLVYIMSSRLVRSTQ